MSVQTEHQLSFEDLICAAQGGGYSVYVYVHPDYGVIYVGQTGNIDARVAAHASRSAHSERDHRLMRASKVYYTRVRGPDEALNLEANLIQRLKPTINIDRGVIRSRLKLKAIRRLDWHLYEKPAPERTPEEMKLRLNLVQYIKGLVLDSLLMEDTCMTWM